MPPRCSLFLLVPLLALVLAACGGEAKGPAASPTSAATPTTAAAKGPALASAPLRTGEILFSGEASPATHGPFALDGRYLVRFEQFAPEDPKLDFSGQTPFTARLRPEGSRADGLELFGSKQASGRRELTRHGRFELEVTFGDFPYAVRFTPKR